MVGGAIAEVAQANGKDLAWQVTAEATKGTQENLRRLQKGELDFALANAAISYFAVRGEKKWEQPVPVRAVMTLAPNVAMFLTTESSGIRTIADLRGKRVVVGPAGAGFEHFIGPILGAHGLSYDDFTPLHAPQFDAVSMLGESADAAFLGGAVPTPSIEQACSVKDVVFIPFDPAAKERLIEAYSFFGKSTIPQEKYGDLKGPYEGMNVGNMQLVTVASVDEETVYQFTKRVYENAAQVVERHPAGKAINAKNVVRDTGTAFHPGAIRFYTEIGVWREE